MIYARTIIFIIETLLVVVPSLLIVAFVTIPEYNKRISHMLG